MQKPLTLKEALQTTADLWSWLQESPCRYKDDWPGWKLLEDPMLVNCPCCEYVEQQREHPVVIAGEKVQDEGPFCASVRDDQPRSKEGILYCPLRKLWPFGCMSFNAAYDRWLKTTGDKRCAAAAEIADAARKELEHVE